MAVNELEDLIFENYYKEIEFIKERRYYSVKRLKRKALFLITTKLIEKLPDLRNTKENYQLTIRKKQKISTRIKNNYLATKNL